MAVTRRPVMAEELPRIPNDSLRRELVRGEVRTMARARDFHGGIVMNMSTPLDQHVRANGLRAVFTASTGFKTSTNPDTVRAPDAAFVRRERVDAVGEADGHWPGAPDLAVGVVSPNDRFAEIEQKVADWFAAGTLVVVVVMHRARSSRSGPAKKRRSFSPKGRFSTMVRSYRAGRTPPPTCSGSACDLTWKPSPTSSTRSGAWVATDAPATSCAGGFSSHHRTRVARPAVVAAFQLPATRRSAARART
jgi:Uma2 family endonuclease